MYYVEHFEYLSLLLLGSSVVSVSSPMVMGQSNHEEADTRIVVHARHALENGADSIIVRTVDTDVIVILVGKLFDLLAYNEHADVWVAFGMKRHFSYVNINKSVPLLENQKQEDCLCSMLSLDATAHRSSLASERRHGKQTTK